MGATTQILIFEQLGAGGSPAGSVFDGAVFDSPVFAPGVMDQGGEEESE